MDKCFRAASQLGKKVDELICDARLMKGLTFLKLGASVLNLISCPCLMCNCSIFILQGYMPILAASPE